MSSNPQHRNAHHHNGQRTNGQFANGRPASVSAEDSVVSSSDYSADTNTSVPSDLIAAINAISEPVVASVGQNMSLSKDQRVVVEVLGDAFIRIVVDALAVEIDRIAAGGAIRS